MHFEVEDQDRVPGVHLVALREAHLEVPHPLHFSSLTVEVAWLGYTWDR